MKKRRERINYVQVEKEVRRDDVSRQETNLENPKLSGIVKKILFS